MNPNHMFSGEFAFLSNMYPCSVNVEVNGTDYSFSNSEAAFHAGKCIDPNEIKLLQDAKTGKIAKQIGRCVKMRSDWNSYRLKWMEIVVRAKFEQNPDLMRMLLNTDSIPLIETNTWNDCFWGICRGKGLNHLGEILMKIREEEKDRRKGDKI